MDKQNGGISSQWNVIIGSGKGMKYGYMPLHG